MFWHSITKPEQDRLVSALHFELGKVESYEVRHRMIHEIFNKVDHELARRAAAGIGVPPPETTRRGRSRSAPRGERRAPEEARREDAQGGDPRGRGLRPRGADGDEGGARAAGARTMVVSKFLGTLQGTAARWRWTRAT
jgi:hypothetical protein